MSTTHGNYVDSKTTDAGNAWADDERWALALRIASSRQLFKANQLREILLYICQRALTDPNTAIREHEIGCSVLGRRADFNPNDDNIVRVQISHLRKKLDEYFATDGQSETLLLTIPKGSYVPRFSARTIIVPEPVALPVPVPEKPRQFRWVFPAALVLLALSVAGGLILRHKLSVPDTAARPGENLIWSSIFNPASPPSIVVADTCLVMMQDTLGTDISLDDYIGGHYPENLLSKVSDEPLRRTLTLLASRQYTSLGDVDISGRLGELSQRLGAASTIHYARHLNIRNFENGNFVLIGSRRGNPWVGLFEPQLNFAMLRDEQTKTFYFHNKDPKSGEPADYKPERNGASIVESYADIALVPNLSKTGNVLILNGITMEASEAAGQLLLRRDFPATLNKLLGSAKANTNHLEILIRVRSLGGAASNADIIATRLQ
jgi:hypothetical protein